LPVALREADVDPELDAMSKVADAVGGLESDARARVIRWAAERFSITVLGSAKPTNRARARTHASSDDAAPEGYEHFADLHDQFAPTSDVERALVCGY
jgi:hypothetical protein